LGRIERLTRGVRRARRLAEHEADPGAAAETARCDVRYDEDGGLVITARLPAEQGAVVLAALEQARAEVDEQGRTAAAAGGGQPSACGKNSSAEESVGGREPAASRADGLVRLAERFLDRAGAERPEAARRSRSRLTVRLDPLSGWARLPDGELLPPTAALSVCDLGRAPRTRQSAARAARHRRRRTLPLPRLHPPA
jgi:hypothetical protein